MHPQIVTPAVARLKRVRGRVAKQRRITVLKAAKMRVAHERKRRCEAAKRAAVGMLTDQQLLFRDVLRSKTFSDLTIGITCARRPSGKSTIENTIKSLRAAGFSQRIHVFSEPGAITQNAALVVDAATDVHENSRRLGCVRNWGRGADWLLKKTRAPWVLMLQDDVAWDPAAYTVLTKTIGYLEQMKMTPRIGFLSPYTSPAMVDRTPEAPGWFDARRDKGFWGALALCIPRDTLQRVLEHPTFVNWRSSKKLDVLVGRVVRYHFKPGLMTMVAFPSLAQHTGEHNSCVRVGRKITKFLAHNRSGYQYGSMDLVAYCNEYMK